MRIKSIITRCRVLYICPSYNFLAERFPKTLKLLLSNPTHSCARIKHHLRCHVKSCLLLNELVDDGMKFTAEQQVFVFTGRSNSSSLWRQKWP